MPIANVRLNTVSDDAYSPLESGPLSDQYNVANPDATRTLLEGQPLTVRIGYQSPNPRLAATIAAITKSCAAAGITVQDVTTDSTGPQALRDGQIDALLASIGGAAGSGSTGSSTMDDYTLHTGNGNNLSAYSNPQVDGIISALAVTIDPGEGPTALVTPHPSCGTRCRPSRCIASSGPCCGARGCSASRPIPPSGVPAGTWTAGR